MNYKTFRILSYFTAIAQIAMIVYDITNDVYDWKTLIYGCSVISIGVNVINGWADRVLGVKK
jgi:hypothetical protein